MTNNNLSSRLISNRIRDDIQNQDTQENAKQATSEVISDPPKKEKRLEKKVLKSTLRNKSTSTPRKKEKILSDEELELLNTIQEQKEVMRLDRKRQRTKVATIILVIACVYVVFLIYGAAVTGYKYSTQGQIEPQVMSISDIKEAKAFEEILVTYEKCRMLYENTLLLDYRVAEGIEDPMTIAPEYERLVADPDILNIQDLYIKTNAMKPDVKYTQIKNMMLGWLRATDHSNTSLEEYVEAMSTAISRNDANSANSAMAARTTIYNNFSIITQNIVTLGENIRGIDITDVKEWSPEKYIAEQTGDTNP